MKKKTLAIIVIVLLATPIFIYAWASYIRDILPPKEAALKAPYQFEEAFNEEMASYGMSIDLDSVNYGYGHGYVTKTVPVQCTDESNLNCRILMTSERKKALIILLEFEQPYDGTIPDNFQPLFEMILRVFETPLYSNRSEQYFDGTYDDILLKYYDFACSDASRMVINVSSNYEQSEWFILERKLNQSHEQGVLLMRFEILTARNNEWLKT